MARLKNNIINLLNKSKESCLLAVEIYNKPLISFKSGGFIILMIVAWTSLFHAIFEKENVNYYYKEKNDYFYKKDKHGNKLAWSLSDCIKHYFKNIDKYENKDYNAIKENLTFFIDFRNEIEHHFMPELDELIFGKCQALLNNYEHIFVKEFGDEFLIDGELSFSLQFSYLRNKNIVPSKEFKKIKNQISQFDQNLTSTITSNEKYSFNVYLIQVSNKNQADYSVGFIHENELDSNTINKIESAKVITRNKKINVSNKGNLKPKEICVRIQKELSKLYKTDVKFSINNLTKCCEEFKIKYTDKDGEKRTNEEYCIYDEVFEGYSYSPKLVKYMLKKFKNKNKFLELFPNQKMKILRLLTSKQASKKIETNLKKYYNNPNFKFGVNFHARCCKHYNIKYKKDSIMYCDEHYCLSCGKGKYGFTKEWIEFITNELKDKEKFIKIFPKQKNMVK